jgi:hypothetical protein
MIKRLIEKLKALRIYAVISSRFYPVYTQEQINHPEKQELEVKCYKNGKYTYSNYALFHKRTD